MKVGGALLALGLAGCATTNQMEMSFQVANAADTVSTHIALQRGCREYNPLLGAKPSDSQLAVSMLASGAIHYAVTKWMEKHGASRKQMLAWQTVTIGVKSVVAVKNATLSCN